MAGVGINVTSLRINQQSCVHELIRKQSVIDVRKGALSLTVPVVVSIWLSRVKRVPVAIFFCCARSNASTGSRTPRLSLSSTAGMLSSGDSKHQR